MIRVYWVPTWHHSYRGRITAEYDGLLDFKTSGKRPTSGYIPRFRNVYKQETDFLRGYASNLPSHPQCQIPLAARQRGHLHR